MVIHIRLFYHFSHRGNRTAPALPLPAAYLPALSLILETTLIMVASSTAASLK